MSLTTSLHRIGRTALLVLAGGLLAGCGHSMGMRHAATGMPSGAAGGCCCATMGAGGQHTMPQGAGSGQMSKSSPSAMAPAPGQASGRFVPPVQMAAGPMCGGEGGMCGGATAGSAGGCACCAGMASGGPSGK